MVVPVAARSPRAALVALKDTFVHRVAELMAGGAPRDEAIMGAVVEQRTAGSVASAEGLAESLRVHG